MWILTGFVLISVAILHVAFRGARRTPRVAGILMATLLGLVCAKASLDALPHWEWAVFPWPGYALVQPLVMYPLAAAFFGVAAARLPIRWNRVIVVLVGLGVIAFGTHRNAWIARPEDHGRSQFADAKHHLQQSTHYTCGPAACVAALSHCGIPISERAMARLCLTRKSGSRLFDLYRGVVMAIGDRPFDASIRALSPEQVIRAGRITVSSNRGGGHAICLIGRGSSALVHDPLDAVPEVWDLSQVRRDYRGPAVLIEPRVRVDPAAAEPPR